MNIIGYHPHTLVEGGKCLSRRSKGYNRCDTSGMTINCHWATGSLNTREFDRSLPCEISTTERLEPGELWWIGMSKVLEAI